MTQTVAGAHFRDADAPKAAGHVFQGLSTGPMPTRTLIARETGEIGGEAVDALADPLAFPPAARAARRGVLGARRR